MMRICVYCGSRPGKRADYLDAAATLGAALAGRGVGLVYGGGRVGIMGRLAQAALDAGGEVIGVIPQALVDRELAHTGVTELRVVQSMHERKALMADLADAFIALPGGIGTLDELMEVLTWAQLGIHEKPCGLLNTAGFFDGLTAFLDHLVEQEFVHPGHRRMLLCHGDVESLLKAMEAYHPVEVDKAGWALNGSAR